MKIFLRGRFGVGPWRCLTLRGLSFTTRRLSTPITPDFVVSPTRGQQFAVDPRNLKKADLFERSLLLQMGVKTLRVSRKVGATDN